MPSTIGFLRRHRTSTMVRRVRSFLTPHGNLRAREPGLKWSEPERHAGVHRGGNERFAGKALKTRAEARDYIGEQLDAYINVVAGFSPRSFTPPCLDEFPRGKISGLYRG